MAVDDDINFQQAMHGVRRLTPARCAITPTRAKLKHANKSYTRARINAVQHESETTTKTSTSRLTAPILPPGTKENETGAAQLFFARPGLQRKVLKNLSRIQHFTADHTLDLHGLSQTEAATELAHFLTQCQQTGQQHLLIIHGKGLHSRGEAKLKAFSANWLKLQHAVLAFSSAHRTAGGNGALVVLLRGKS